MPTRWLSLLIVIFWFGTTSWLFYRDVVPRLWPDAPPPYRIDLTDEAQSNISTQWSIYKDNQNKGYCRTSVNYHEDQDTFELYGEFKYWNNGRGTKDIPDTFVRSSYTVTREGELRALWATLQTGMAGNLTVAGRIEGKVQGGFFSPTVTLERPVDYSQPLKPVKVTQGGSVLNPLQPLHRLPGLRKGQHWQIPLVDPLADLAHKYLKEITGASPVSEVRVLKAHVLEKPEVLIWGGRKEPVVCLVIEYHGEDTTARTWVREKDGLVLQQELTQGNERMVLVRD